MSEKYPPKKREGPLLDRQFKIGRKRFHIFIDACIKSNIWEYNVNDTRWFMRLPPDATFHDRVNIAGELLNRAGQCEWADAHERDCCFRTTPEECRRHLETVGRKPTELELEQLKCQG